MQQLQIKTQQLAIITTIITLMTMLTINLTHQQWVWIQMTFGQYQAHGKYHFLERNGFTCGNINCRKFMKSIEVQFSQIDSIFNKQNQYFWIDFQLIALLLKNFNRFQSSVWSNCVRSHIKRSSSS